MPVPWELHGLCPAPWKNPRLRRQRLPCTTFYGCCGSGWSNTISSKNVQSQWRLIEITQPSCRESPRIPDGSFILGDVSHTWTSPTTHTQAHKLKFTSGPIYSWGGEKFWALGVSRQLIESDHSITSMPSCYCWSLQICVHTTMMIHRVAGKSPSRWWLGYQGFLNIRRMFTRDESIGEFAGIH